MHASPLLYAVVMLRLVQNVDYRLFKLSCTMLILNSYVTKIIVIHLLAEAIVDQPIQILIPPCIYGS